MYFLFVQPCVHAILGQADVVSIRPEEHGATRPPTAREQGHGPGGRFSVGMLCPANSDNQ